MELTVYLEAPIDLRALRRKLQRDEICRLTVFYDEDMSDYVDELGEDLGNCQNLRSLTINPVTEDCATYLLDIPEALAENTTLEELNLAYNALDENAIDALVDMLGKNSTLRSLELTGCEIPPAGHENLFKILRKNQTLHTLVLRKTINTPRIRRIFLSCIEEIMWNSKNLHILNISDNAITGDEFHYCLYGLKYTKSLKILIIRNSLSKFKDVWQLYQVFLQNQNLQLIDVSANYKSSIEWQIFHKLNRRQYVRIKHGKTVCFDRSYFRNGTFY